MRCPYCGFKNIQGADECESCLADLSSIDGLAKKSERNEYIHSVLDQPILNLNPRPVVCVRPSATVAEVIRLMNEIKSGCILVENSQGKLVGIVTERDLIRNLPTNLKQLNTLLVSEIMTTNVEALRSDNSLNQALHQMAVKRFRHIIVYNPAGDPEIISTRDLMKHFSQFLRISKKKSDSPSSKKPIKNGRAGKKTTAKKIKTKGSKKDKKKKAVNKKKK